jgi:hypothetical protein
MRHDRANALGKVDRRLSGLRERLLNLPQAKELERDHPLVYSVRPDQGQVDVRAESGVGGVVNKEQRLYLRSNQERKKEKE